MALRSLRLMAAEVSGGMLLAFLLPLSLPSAWAADVGALIATLNDPRAECRYLQGLWDQSQMAIQRLQENTRELDAVTQRITAQSIINPEDYRRGRELQVQSQAWQIVMTQTLTDYLTAQRIVQARRGSLAQCHNELPFLVKPSSPPSPEENNTAAEQPPSATGNSLQEQLRELKALRAQKLITPEEYYERRAKLLEGS
jgi:hypothetical protein